MKVLVIDCANLTFQYTLPYCEELEKNLCDVTLICSKYKNQKENHLDLFSTIPIIFFKKFKKIVKFIKGINHIIGFIRTFFNKQKKNRFKY